ncbi:MAG: hypothetical protein KF678_04565 [Phycisphaeraceae bacterium]|nr:hypothetical protein [Phycisphaeraceae bacterium]
MKCFSPVVVCVLLMAVGCDKPGPQASGAPGTPSGSSGDAVLPGSLFLSTGPGEGRTPEEVKKSAKAGDTVVIQGLVGGSRDPFIAGRAVFTIVGSGLKPCVTDKGEACCNTPWDYCCDTKEDIAAHAATIRVVDEGGAPLKASIKGQHGIKELSEVVIVGSIAQVDGKVLVVNATGVFVAKP